MAAAALFDFNAAVREPEGLNGFSEIAGRIFRYATAYPGDFKQLGPVLRIGGSLGGLFGQVGIPMRVCDDGVQGNLARLVEFQLAPVGGVLGQAAIAASISSKMPRSPLFSTNG